MSDAVITNSHTEAESSSISHPKLASVVLKGTPVAVAAVVATGCTFVALNDPESKTLFPECGFYAITGFYCPGCGMTRALHNVVTGNIVRAFQFNALLVLSLPVLLYLYLWWTTWAFTGKELPKLKTNKALVGLVLTFIFVFVVGRNFPGEVAQFFARDRI